MHVLAAWVGKWANLVCVEEKWGFGGSWTVDLEVGVRRCVIFVVLGIVEVVVMFEGWDEREGHETVV